MTPLAQSPGGGVLLPSLAMIGSTLFWGSMWIGLREIDAAGVHATLGGTLVYGLPAILLLPIVFLRWTRIRRDAKGLLLCAAPLALCNILFAMAVVIGEVGMIVLMFYLSPIWSTILERVFLKVSISPLRWAGIGLALIGLLVLQGGHGRLPWPSNFPALPPVSVGRWRFSPRACGRQSRCSTKACCNSSAHFPSVSPFSSW